MLNIAANQSTCRHVEINRLAYKHDVTDSITELVLHIMVDWIKVVDRVVMTQLLHNIKCLGII